MREAKVRREAKTFRVIRFRPIAISGETVSDSVSRHFLSPLITRVSHIGINRDAHTTLTRLNSDAADRGKQFSNVNDQDIFISCPFIS